MRVSLRGPLALVLFEVSSSNKHEVRPIGPVVEEAPIVEAPITKASIVETLKLKPRVPRPAFGLLLMS